MKSQAKKILAARSITCNGPALHNFPFTYVDIFCPYNIFHVEPMHFIHLGVTKLLLTCLSDRLRSDTRRTSFFSSDVSRVPKKSSLFYKVRTPVLHALNSYLRSVDDLRASSTSKVNFSNENACDRLDGLFTNDGLKGMLEAKNFTQVEMVMPFLGAIVDEMLDENDSYPCTKLFSLYSSIIMSLFSNNKGHGWDDYSLTELGENIATFKEKAVSLFQEFQASGMGTLKFHMLDHILHDLRIVGGIFFMDASSFEHSHVHFKEKYRETSKRRATAMTETVERLCEEEAIASWAVNMKNLNSFRRNHADTPQPNVRLSRMKRDAISIDTLVLSRDGPTITMHDIHMCWRYKRLERKKLAQTFTQPTSHSLDMFHKLGEDGMRCFERELGRYIGLQDMLVSPVHVHFTVLSSGYVPGLHAPGRSHLRIGPDSTAFVPSQSKRVMQRVVSCINFHGNGRVRQDVVMLRVGSQQVQGEDCEYINGDAVWFGKILCLIRLPESILTTHRTAQDVETELAFIQYFEIIPDVDVVDNVLDCVRLRWARNDAAEMYGTTDSKMNGKWFGLCTVSSILGRVDIVPADVPKRGGAPRLWDAETFYVNKYFRHPESSCMEEDLTEEVILRHDR